MSIGLEKDKSIKVTVITIEGESYIFDEPCSRDEARALARKILREGFSINGNQSLRLGEEQHFPPASVYKVAIHKTTHVEKG